MTPEGFAALVKLLRMTGAPSIEAARLVLVEGKTQTEAAQATGISLPGASQAVKRCKAGIALAKEVAEGAVQFPREMV